MTSEIEQHRARLNVELVALGHFVEYAEQLFTDADLYFGHGSFEAFDEAVYLVLSALKLPLDELDSVWNRRVNTTERAAVLQLIHRRVDERIPAAYLTNEAFLGPYRFYVDERVIVPRSFIAELLRDQLSPWVDDPDSVSSVLDLCTGSGCLAILAALTFPNAHVDATDLSSDALDVAKRNVAEYAFADRVTVTQSDLFAGLKRQQYDIIITNPPYVTAASMNTLPDEYHREPEMALASGVDGLDHVRVILRDAPQHLKPGGLLLVEVGFNREAMEAAFPHLPLTWLETSAGDGVVFLVTGEELLSARPRAE